MLNQGWLHVARMAQMTLVCLLTATSCTKSKPKTPAPVVQKETKQDQTDKPQVINKPNIKPDSEVINASADSANTEVINASRPDTVRRDSYKPVPNGYSLTTVQEWVKAHKAKAGEGFKYVYLDPAYATQRDTANTLRVALAKAWNHLSWLPELDLPVDISDGAGLAFALNAPKLWGADAEKNWGYIANCTPKRNISVSPAARRNCDRFAATEPVTVERFVFNAMNGGPYANIHKTPPFFDSFRQKYRMGPIFATSTQKDAIVCGPRIIAYRLVFPNLARGEEAPKYATQQEALELVKQGKGLIYSYTSDEFDGRDNGSIRYTSAPTGKDQRGTGALRAAPNDDDTAVASEWWIQLPNGFMYYSIHGEGSQERGRAEFPFAADPANWRQGAELTTGRSCITCHIRGNQAAPTDAEYEGKNGWTANADLSVLNNFSVKKFVDPLTKLTQAMSDDEGPLNEKILSGTIEPIKQAIMQIEGPFTGRSNGTCEYFCNGKFGSERKNLCSTLPAR